MAYKLGMVKLIVGYGRDVARAIEVIQRYYAKVDGHSVSKAEVFRRAVIILANHINNKEQTQS